MTPPALSRTLRTIAQDQPHTLSAAVAAEALQHGDPAVFLADVVRYGCQSGAVSSLIATCDANDFALRHYDEVLELRGDVEESLGEPLRLGYYLLNDLAWFAFEETAARLADEFGVAT